MNLLMISTVLFLAIFAIKFSKKSGVPALLLFIVLGLIFNKLGFGLSDFVFADQFATVALLVIMFQGGFSTNWAMSKPVAAPAIVLSSLGTAATALLVGLFCHYVLGSDLIGGMLIGSIVGSTDYSSVSNVLRSKNLNLKYNTASLLELESGSNDPFAYTMTMIFLAMKLGKQTNVISMIFLQVVLGTILGFVFAFAFHWIIKKLDLASDGFLVLFMVATSIFVFAATNQLQGNGYLAVYIYGIYLGNKTFKGKRETVFFYDGLGDLMQIALFFMLGLLADISSFVKWLPMAAAIMFFMFLVARPLAVFVLSIPFKLKTNQKLVISMAGLRGAAAIAFAIMATNSGVELATDIYNIVFGICVLSSLIQGFLMAPSAHWFNMLDPTDTVLRTFNDYQDKSDIGFIQTRINPTSRWVGSTVSEINMAFDVIVAKIDRQGKTVVPRGDTVIEEDDIIVLGGESYFDPSGTDLKEFSVDSKHEYVGKTLAELKLPDRKLIIMIQRKDGTIVVPSGNTEIMADDVLVSISESNTNAETKKPRFLLGKK